MVDLNAPGGDPLGRVGRDYDYNKLPKANIDGSGDWVLWTSNCGGNRLDAFLVRVPWRLLA